MAATEHHPDLVLTVRERRQEGEFALTHELEVRSRQLGLDLKTERFPPVSIRRDPFAYLTTLFRDVEDLSLASEELRQQATHRLAGIGVTLFEELLPEKLRRRLWSLRGMKPAPTLFLLSDETWVPWELLKLSDPDKERSGGEVHFLVESFAFTRWLVDRPQTLELPLRNLALIVSGDSGLPGAASEHEFIHRLDTRVTDVPARFCEVLGKLAAGDFDAWHFTGHGLRPDRENPYLLSLQLDKGEQLKAADLREIHGLRQKRPWIFLNACHSARSTFTLTGHGGFAQAFLRVGAGAFFGAHWAVVDEKARNFATTCYQHFLAGRPLGEAVRRTRSFYKKKYPGDPTWLAYAVYGHPLALRDEAASRWSAGERSPLGIPQHDWRPDRSPPGGLLRPEYGVVPFHGRVEEFEDLSEWCRSDAMIGIRLYTGAGGMGKTRFLLEACRRLSNDGWITGFLLPEADQAPWEAWQTLAGASKPLLLVTDYAETRRDLLVPILRGIWNAKQGPVRLVLLARAALDWWEALKSEGEGVGDLLQGPATSERSLAALALSSEDRARSFHLAAAAFAEKLGKPAPKVLPENLDAKYFERVLFLHMTSLAATEGVELEDEDRLLDYVLTRERRFWERLATRRGLPETIMPGIGRALAVVTLCNGADTESEAVNAFQELSFLADQRPDVLIGVARLLHECYPGEHWIEPVMPDLLGEHLIQRELEAGGAEELFGVVFR